MSLEEKIKEQYGSRESTDHLYNSVYSRMADVERCEKVKYLLSNYDVTKGTILEIGAGQGDNVNLLVECGFTLDRISLNELLPERISSIKQKYPNLRLYEGDALKINFGTKFDCVFQSTVFTSILNNEDRKKLASGMWNLLKPGGIILWYDFIYNNPSNPNVKKVSVHETENLFPNAETSEIISVTLAPPIGRRVGKMYKLFNLPFLRSHILAVFQKQA